VLFDSYIAQNSSRLSGPTPTPASRQVRTVCSSTPAHSRPPVSRKALPLTNTHSLQTIDPAFLKWQQATTGAEKQLAMKEYEKYEGKFRFVVQSWPLEE
jgi:hypothetical protein